MKVIIYADGGSRGNPGTAGSGTVVYAADGVTALREIVYVVGKKSTNNVAEYHGLLRGLEAAVDLGATDVEVHMDSKLVVEQISGRWKIKHPDMQKLAAEAQRIIRGFDSFSIDWVPRDKNKVADALSNQAMDACAAGHPVGIVGGDAQPKHDDAPVAVPATPATTSTLVLVCHGETPQTAAGQMSGRMDAELTPRGHRQALLIAEAVRGRWDADAVLTSPRTHCRWDGGRTEDGLRGLDYGAWEGLDAAAAQERDAELFRAWREDTNVAAPGGESVRALHRRVRALREKLSARGGTLVLVTHAEVIKAFVREALDANPAVFHHLHVEPGSISVVEFAETGSLVRSVNETAHLR